MTRRDTDQRAADRRKQAGTKAPQLNPDIQGEIGKALRDMYDDIVKQGVPDRFSALLHNLDDPQGDKETPPSE